MSRRGDGRLRVPMRRRVAPLPWAALGLLALLAGCLQSGGGDGPSTSSSPSPAGGLPPSAPQPPPAGSPTVVALLPEFALGPCAAVSMASAQPLDAVQALLPEGFRAAPYQTASTGLAGLDLYACGNLTTPNARIADTVYGQVYTLVERPADAVPGAPEAGVHEYVFRVLAAQDVLAALWPAAGYETRNGTASVSVDAPPLVPLDAEVRTGSGSVGADYGALADGQDHVPASGWAGSFARYTRLADGSVLLWTGRYETAAAFEGHGSFSVAGDDPFAAFEAGNAVPGSARLSESLTMAGMDLRRVFP